MLVVLFVCFVLLCFAFFFFFFFLMVFVFVCFFFFLLWCLFSFFVCFDFGVCLFQFMETNKCLGISIKFLPYQLHQLASSSSLRGVCSLVLSELFLFSDTALSAHASYPHLL